MNDMNLNDLELLKNTKLDIITIEEFFNTYTTNGDFIQYEYNLSKCVLSSRLNHINKMNRPNGIIYVFETYGLDHEHSVGGNNKLPNVHKCGDTFIYYRRVDALMDLLNIATKSFNAVSELLDK